MKNIEAIMKDAGVELTDEQKDAIVAGVKENYKTIADYDKQATKVSTLEDSLRTTQEELKKFDGVNAEELKSKIAELTQTIADNETAYNNKIADRDFNDLIKSAINDAKGKNVKAITALLNIDELKASKNQKDDIALAIKALTEAEDSKMLFGETIQQNGTGDPIGTIKKTGATETMDMRSALAEHFNK